MDDVKELVQVCGDDNRLHIITSGALPPNPAELLKSGRLDRLLEELKRTMIISYWITRLMVLWWIHSCADGWRIRRFM